MISGETIRAAVLHGAGYVARDLIRLIAFHPEMELVAATSESRAGDSIENVHPPLRGLAGGKFVRTEDIDLAGIDVLFSCGHHGPYLDEIVQIDRTGFDGVVVDLSANFRLQDPDCYEQYYGFVHKAPELLSRFIYGLPERNADGIRRARRIANPGCFATGVVLSIAPLADHFEDLAAHIVALTGASGAGVTARKTTHFPERDGNARAYNIWKHRHTPEIKQALAHPVDLNFVPASGPWTYGIWGVITVTGVAAGAPLDDIFQTSYGDKPFVRLFPDELPELGPATRTPFVDIGWKVRDDGLALVGFALDNLLKGAASAAIQNANLALGLPETAGLLGHALRSHARPGT